VVAFELPRAAPVVRDTQHERNSADHESHGKLDTAGLTGGSAQVACHEEDLRSRNMP
jgi:hypothetical protein